MPELPDVVVYIEALEERILGEQLERLTISSPFLLRTASPSASSFTGKSVTQLRRIGKRIAIGFEGDLWLVLHLMIAGRLHWKDALAAGSKSGRSVTRGSVKQTQKKLRPGTLAIFEFSNGNLSLTEAGTQRRASLHLIQGETDLQQFDRGGAEVFEIDAEAFAAILKSENHTLKRALTDPRLFSGIGNAYSDEILFEAQLSPVALTQKLSSEATNRLFTSVRSTLTKWTDALRKESRKKRADTEASSRVRLAFPEKVTAFREEMAVHGRYLQPCIRCGGKIQRIRYASNETNYCPNCQTSGKLLADRALSRLLRSDWPRTAEELEGR